MLDERIRRKVRRLRVLQDRLAYARVRLAETQQEAEMLLIQLESYKFHRRAPMWMREILNSDDLSSIFSRLYKII